MTLTFRDAHCTRTHPSGRFRTTVAVTMPFKVYFKYLDRWWMGWSTPVHDRQDGWMLDGISVAVLGTSFRSAHTPQYSYLPRPSDTCVALVLPSDYPHPLHPQPLCTLKPDRALKIYQLPEAPTNSSLSQYQDVALLNLAMPHFSRSLAS